MVVSRRWEEDADADAGLGWQKESRRSQEQRREHMSEKANLPYKGHNMLLPFLGLMMDLSEDCKYFGFT